MASLCRFEADTSWILNFKSFFGIPDHAALFNQPSPKPVILGLLSLIAADREGGFFFEQDAAMHNWTLAAKFQGEECLRPWKPGVANRLNIFSDQFHVSMTKNGGGFAVHRRPAVPAGAAG